jgi:hypothetical protein
MVSLVFDSTDPHTYAEHSEATTDKPGKSSHELLAEDNRKK